MTIAQYQDIAAGLYASFNIAPQARNVWISDGDSILSTIAAPVIDTLLVA